MAERETVRCRFCELNQYVTGSGNCRRCGKPLAIGSVASVSIVYIPASLTPAAVIPMREVMRAAAVHAVQCIGYTTKAAQALGIPHARLKQMLREAGATRDWRYGRRK